MKRVAQPATGLTIALIYTRVSSEDQRREGMSLDAQLADCRRYAARQGWLLSADHEYQDVLKGTRDDRPRYQALLADARCLRGEGRSVAVVVAALDRFGRRLLERVRSREELKALGAPTHSVREGGEVSDIVANVLAAVAQEEIRRLGERVGAVRSHLGSNGWKLPGRAAWGYRWRPATADERAQGAPASVLEVDPITGPYAREMFQRVAAGESVRRVALWIAGLPAAVRSGRNLRYARVRAALSTPTYVGRLEVHPEPNVLQRPMGRWPALIDDRSFRLVQEQIGSHVERPKQASGQYLLTGFMRCAKCGMRMTGDGGGGRQTYRYRCNGALHGSATPSPGCNFTAIGPPVEMNVRTQVGRLVDVVATRDATMHLAIRRAWAGLQAPDHDGELPQRIRQLEIAGEQARERLKRAALLFVDGALDQAGYELAREQAEADLGAAERELGRLRGLRQEPALPSIDVVLQDAGSWPDVVEGSDLEAQRALQAKVVDHVVPERIRAGQYRVRIAWTTTGDRLQQLADTIERVSAT